MEWVLFRAVIPESNDFKWKSECTVQNDCYEAVLTSKSKIYIATSLFHCSNKWTCSFGESESFSITSV